APPCPPCVGGNPNGRAPPLRGHSPASSLLRAHPPPSRLRPTSRGVRLYGRACSAAFARGARRASPVARHVLVTVPSLPPRRSRSPHQPTRDDLCGLRLTTEGSASGADTLSGPPVRSLSLRPGDSLTIPRMASSMGFRTFGFPPACHSSDGALALTPVGLTPTEHASLRWAHCRRCARRPSG